MCISKEMTGVPFVDVFIDVANDETLRHGASLILEQIRLVFGSRAVDGKRFLEIGRFLDSRNLNVT